MNNNEVMLTPTEWNVMECLWESFPKTGREACEYLSSSVGWTRSTTLTMLKRMSDKGYICCEEKDGVKVYSPLIKREDAVISETRSFIDRVYKGSVSMLISHLTQKQALSKDEIDELYEILKTAEEKK